MNIVDTLFARCDREAVALVCGDLSLTYGQLEAEVHRAAAALLEAGLPEPRPGFVPRVGLACPNGPDHVILALAVLRAGGCLVPVAGELAAPEREALIRTVGVHAVVVADEMTWPGREHGGKEIPERAYDGKDPHREGTPPSPESGGTANGFRHRAGGDPTPWKKRTRCVTFTSGALTELSATLFLEPRRSTQELGFEEASIADLSPAFIRFSSGTTGRSKGIVLSHASLMARIETGNRRLGITAQDRVVWILPMAHHFAVSIMLYLLKGATTVVVRSHLPEDILDAALRHEGTVLYGAPFHHTLLAREPSGRPWPTLRLAVSTAAALPLATARAFDSRYGVPLSQGFGIIEAGLPLLNTAAPREKPESVGRPLDDMAVDFRDPVTGLAVAAGEVGELFLQADGMLDAYLNPWRLRGDILADGPWFQTGDLARQDADGFVYVVGRTNSVINSAGMKCFPEEVEAVIQSHPGVLAVRVSGQPHPHFGAVPVADIIAGEPAPSATSLAAHCRNALAQHKIPVEFRFVKDLPRTNSGKIRRF
jgi:long-chain acyl-CoA synthetase